MERLKVLYDHEIFSRQATGGISRYFVDLLTAFHKEEVSPMVLAPFHANTMLRTLPSAYVQGIDLRSPHFYTVKAPFFFINHAINRLQGIIQSADLVHETYYAPRANFGKKRPVVITIHDFVHERYPELFSKLDNSVFLKRNAIQRADHLICISENTKNDLERFYPTVKTPTSVIYHGLSSPIELNINEQPNAKPYILYVGSRMAYKNFGVLLQAFAQNKRLKSNFELLAFGGGAFSADEQAQIHALGLSKVVKQTGGNDYQLAAAYKMAVAMVYPSLYEGFGFPPLEAMSYHCPVIAANTSCLPEILEDSVSYFNPTKPEELVHCLLQLVDDDGFRRTLIEKGKMHIRRFSWRSTAAKTLEVYRGLVG